MTSAGKFEAKVACGTFGKRSNLDLRWDRPFTRKKSAKLNNYIGVKYHVTGSLPADRIGLHLFRNGYCGISKIEEERYCLCYMTTARDLKACGNSIPELETTILRQNPYLEEVFSSTTRVFDQPVTIAQISFERKTQVENHVFTDR